MIEDDDSYNVDNDLVTDYDLVGMQHHSKNSVSTEKSLDSTIIEKS